MSMSMLMTPVDVIKSKPILDVAPDSESTKSAAHNMSNKISNEGVVDEEVGVEEAPPEPDRDDVVPASGAKVMPVAGVTFVDAQLPLFIVLIASIVLLIATGAHYSWETTAIGGYSSYAISVSSVTLSLSCLALLLAKLSEDTYSKVGKHMNTLCFIYSFVGACFLTFDKPFTETGNGYFAAWAVVYGNAMAMGVTASSLGSSIKGLGAVMGLLASSLVLVLASIAPIRDESEFREEAVYAMVLACVTFVFVVFVVAMDKKDVSLPSKIYFAALAILTMCWIIMACLGTFRGPFKVTGNGYFASWAGAGTVSMAAFAAMSDMQ